MFPAACEATFDKEVGGPPTERLEATAAAIRRACTSLSPARWRSAQEDAVRALAAAHSELAPPRRRPDLSAIARARVGVEPAVYCWAPAAWAPFLEHYAIVRGGEQVSLRSIVDTSRNRIDLDPSSCAALNRYLQGLRPLKLSSQNLELAEALVVLTHAAEHLKNPSLSEAAAECYAMQHVRPLVRNAWGPELAAEIALHAWEISYPRLPRHFRTPACRNGGQLDRNPRSSTWP